jgi:hypothetical protein
LKINGYAVPVKEISYIVLVTAWLTGLSFQVDSNAEDIDKQEDTVERLARIEEKQEATKEEVKEIKEEQKDQGMLLVKILEKVSESQ